MSLVTLEELLVKQEYYIVQEVYSRNVRMLKSNNFLGSLEKIDIDERDNAFIYNLTFKVRPTESYVPYHQSNTNIIIQHSHRGTFIRLRIVVLKGVKPNNIRDIQQQQVYRSAWYDKFVTQNNEIIGPTYIQSNNNSEESYFQKIKFFKFQNSHALAVFKSGYNNLPEDVFGRIGNYVGSNRNATQAIIDFQQQRQKSIYPPSKKRRTHKGGKNKKRKTKKRRKACNKK